MLENRNLAKDLGHEAVPGPDNTTTEGEAEILERIRREKEEKEKI